jgi:hypothetical protein
MACTLPVASSTTTTTSSDSSDDATGTAASTGNVETSSDGSLQTPTTDIPQSTATESDDPTGAASAGDTTDTAPQDGLPAADIGLAAPQITEVLPNPASPQTDASDEFVEIYNANDVPFDLTGFSLTAGLATIHRFSFTSGTTLPPKSFTTFFSADTSLSLSNTDGQVVLLDPSGNRVSQTDAYGAAPDGQAWALTNGTWGWTTTPTPNAPNAMTAPVAAASKTTAKTTLAAKKTTTKRAATTAKTKTSKPKSGAAKTVGSTTASSLDANMVPTPVHASALAFVALFAILYGAYEYRGDVANRLHQFRSYRSARSKARLEPARRRGG